MQLGFLLIIFNILILTIVIFFKRFGFAEQFANFFVITSIIYIIYKISKIKKEQQTPKTNLPQKTILFLGLGIVLVLVSVYGTIFLNGPAAWGDAPYYYPETFKNFLNEPLVWESRGRLGIVNDLYFIYPLMFLYNHLGVIFGFSNDIVIRLIFYFPSLIFAFLGPWFFTRNLGFSKLVSLFTSFLYLFNTYIILILDGGQIGVALAYSLFPLTLFHLHKLLKKTTNNQFFITLIFLMFITMADVRFAVITILTFLFWLISHKLLFKKSINHKQLKIYLGLILSVLALSAYWLVPLFLLTPTTGSGLRSDLKLISILNPLMIFSPHWPFNEFGKISPPSWFFMGIPILIFSNLFNKNRNYLFIMLNFLIFVFLAKGDSGFLGNIYGRMVDTIPMGGAFRDSTKFFAPVILYAGILIGLSVENISQKIKKNIYSQIFVFLIFGYLIFLLYPALLGNMHGVLAKREFPEEVINITTQVSNEDGFLRTVWLPERHPLGFSTEGKPALDGKSLVNLRPFASLNVGVTDRFNFLHNKQSLEWFDLLGIKYLIFSGDTRKVIPNKEIEKDWSDLLSLVGSIDRLQKVDLGSIPVFQTPSNKPRIFATDKIFAVVGGDDIYQKLIENNNNFSIGNQGFVFFDDGKFNSNSLKDVSSQSLVIILNQKQKEDLVLATLSNLFISPLNNIRSDWAIRGAEDYLKWKFELLVNKIKTNEFDFSKGLAFSSIPNEKIEFNLSGKENADYILAIRYMSGPGSENIHLLLENLEYDLPSSPPDHFKWYIKEVNLSAGQHNLIIENKGGFQVLNVVTLIPKKDWEEATTFAEKLLDKYEVVDMKVNNENLNNPFLISNWHEVNYQMISPVRYKVSEIQKANWLVFSDSYHQSWTFRNNTKSISPQPFYSIINGFYLGDNTSQGVLIFTDQKKIHIGMVISLASAFVLVASFLLIRKR